MPRKKGTPYLVDISGHRFNRWLVLSRIAGSLWMCRCDCGTEKAVSGSSLKLGTSPSCGCLSKERVTKHGMEGTAIYNTWAQMLARCNNPNSTSYKNYGAKGIKVCERWKDFRNFYADMGDKKEGMTIDRIDNESGYSPDNVRWSNWKTQSRNKRNTIFLEFDGQKRPMSEWSEIKKIKRKVLENRIRAGWSIEDALTIKGANRWTRTKTK